MISKYLQFILLFPLLLCQADIGRKHEEGEVLVSKVAIEKDFHDYLMSDPVMLTVGGCKIYKTPEGKLLLVAVGMTSTAGKSLVKILDDVADKPYEKLARFTNVKVSVYSRASRTTRITMENSQEYTLSRKELVKRIVSFSEAYFCQFQVIGHWYSLDGKTYYQAVGKILELEDEE